MSNQELKVPMELLASTIINTLMEKGATYGDSWKSRGGIGAFMMLARKWDRLENQAKAKGYDIFQCIQGSAKKDGIIDDIDDLIGYLFLCRGECVLRGGEKLITSGCELDALGEVVEIPASQFGLDPWPPEVAQKVAENSTEDGGLAAHVNPDHDECLWHNRLRVLGHDSPGSHCTPLQFIHIVARDIKKVTQSTTIVKLRDGGAFTIKNTPKCVVVKYQEAGKDSTQEEVVGKYRNDDEAHDIVATVIWSLHHAQG